jgi:hypothetical protein
MAVVTERPLVPTPLAAGEPEVRPTPVIGVIAAIPAAPAPRLAPRGSEPSSRPRWARAIPCSCGRPQRR